MNTITYMTGLLTFYLKGVIETDGNFLKIKIPNTILSLIPLGSKKDNIPVTQLSTVSSNFKMKFGRFLSGIIVCIIAIILFLQFNAGGIILGLVFLIWGATIIINSFTTELKIEATSGKEYYIPFLIFEKSKASQAEHLINSMIAGRLNDTNNRQVAEAQTSAIVDAINNQK